MKMQLSVDEILSPNGAEMKRLISNLQSEYPDAIYCLAISEDCEVFEAFDSKQIALFLPVLERQVEEMRDRLGI